MRWEVNWWTESKQKGGSYDQAAHPAILVKTAIMDDGSKIDDGDVPRVLGSTPVTIEMPKE